MDQSETPRRSKRQVDRAPATAATASPVYPVMGAPVTFTRRELEGNGKKKKKKAKRGSSRAARRVEDVERRVSKSVRRVTRAVNRGMGTYIDRRNKSANRRRDGAIVDFYQNVARGASDAIADSSPALVDLAKALNRRRDRKLIRRTMRRLPRIPFLTV